MVEVGRDGEGEGFLVVYLLLTEVDVEIVVN
jgi:hypothetical protein